MKIKYNMPKFGYYNIQIVLRRQFIASGAYIEKKKKFKYIF